MSGVSTHFALSSFLEKKRERGWQLVLLMTICIVYIQTCRQCIRLHRRSSWDRRRYCLIEKMHYSWYVSSPSSFLSHLPLTPPLDTIQYPYFDRIGIETGGGAVYRCTNAVASVAQTAKREYLITLNHYYPHHIINTHRRHHHQQFREHSWSTRRLR